ncbi:MAG: DUF2784 domain-containing protein [Motiliproteus sp.]|nr:DUF2784 domain-containing protein [Motiliproteus sp.]MCW9051483.1 DUF2784 domain-containing protein [Motiliproteus sp.]
MIYRLLADLTVCLHLLFILFVVFGGLLVFHWPKLAWLHIPAFLWGGGIEIGGWICPLTYLENDLRSLGATAGYDTSFVEQYILPLIYPQILFGDSFPPQGFLLIGIAVLLINGFIYIFIWKKVSRKSKPSH